MGEVTAVRDRLPVALSPYGPFEALALRVHHLVSDGRYAEAMQAADDYTHLMRAAGDQVTCGYLLQGRMYALLDTGRLEEALATGQELLQLRRSLGTVAGEAKTHGDIAEVQIRAGYLEEGLRNLARASMLLGTYGRADILYASAAASISDGARAAELYELADRVLGPMWAKFAGGHQFHIVQAVYGSLLLEWGMRLKHLGLVSAAAARFRRVVDLTRAAGSLPGQGHPRVLAVRALGLAELGHVDEAVDLAHRLLGPLREQELYPYARWAHLAYATALRARGDRPAAMRELLAAEQLPPANCSPAERLIVEYELALLTADELPAAAVRRLLAGMRGQALRLWELRLQRVSMLSQAERREELEAARETAQTAMLQDTLTGLGNRRRFEEMIADVDAGLATTPLTLVFVDLDEFKSINDTFSHRVGDRVLADVADTIRAYCRDDDVPVRFGGDELAVFLRADLPSAVRAAERIRRAVAMRDWGSVADGLRVTVSMGAAQWRPGMAGADLLDEADRALYRAKRRGRDQVAAGD